MMTQTSMLEQEEQGAWALIGSTLFTLVLLGGVALWLSHAGQDGTAPAITATSATISSSDGRAVGPRGQAAPAMVTTREPSVSTIYLVGSEEEGEALRDVFSFVGLAPPFPQILVVETDEHASQVRADLGWPGTRIIDRRARAGTRRATPPMCSAEMQQTDC